VFEDPRAIYSRSARRGRPSPSTQRLEGLRQRPVEPQSHSCSTVDQKSDAVTPARRLNCTAVVGWFDVGIYNRNARRSSGVAWQRTPIAGAPGRERPQSAQRPEDLKRQIRPLRATHSAYRGTG